jgi:hypothetical protein
VPLSSVSAPPSLALLSLLSVALSCALSRAVSPSPSLSLSRSLARSLSLSLSLALSPSRSLSVYLSRSRCRSREISLSLSPSLCMPSSDLYALLCSLLHNTTDGRVSTCCSHLKTPEAVRAINLLPNKPGVRMATGAHAPSRSLTDALFVCVSFCGCHAHAW